MHGLNSNTYSQPSLEASTILIHGYLNKWTQAIYFFLCMCDVHVIQRLRITTNRPIPNQIWKLSQRLKDGLKSHDSPLHTFIMLLIYATLYFTPVTLPNLVTMVTIAKVLSFFIFIWLSVNSLSLNPNLDRRVLQTRIQFELWLCYILTYMMTLMMFSLQHAW